MFSHSNGFELIENNNDLFITGPSCGIGTQIKTLNYIPVDLQKHPCSIIQFEKLSPFKHSGKATF